MDIKVVSTNEQITLEIPENQDEVTKIVEQVQLYMNRFAKEVSEKFNISLKDINDSIPDSIFISLDEKKKPKPKPKIAKITLDNWKTAENMESLKSLTTTDLKNILSCEGLGITGNKQVLLERVWNIIAKPGDEIKAPKKKRSAKRKKSPTVYSSDTSSMVEDSDKEEDNEEQDENIKNIIKTGSKLVYINKKTKKLVKKHSSNTIECILVPSYKWVFMNSKDQLEFLGVLDSENILSEIDPPQKLLDLYSQL